MEAVAARQSLESYMAGKIGTGDSHEIRNFVQPSAGWSDEAFIFDLHWKEKGHSVKKGFAIRKQNKGGLMRETKDFSLQFSFLAWLEGRTSLPVPKVHWFEADESILGGPFFVMDRLPGKSYVPWSREGQRFLTEAYQDGNIPLQFVRMLADLHNLQVDGTELPPGLALPEGPLDYISEKLAGLEKMYNQYQLAPDPIMEDALAWMKANRPPAQRYAVVHNDYRTGNLLYENREITGVLDWEAAEIGDPMADVGYVCAKSNRMDSPLLCYLIERGQFLEKYEEFTGLVPDEAAIHFYEVFHQVRFVLISQSAGTAFNRGETGDLRLARQGYRWPLMRSMVAELLGY